MRSKRGKGNKCIVYMQIFLIVSMSFTLSFLLSGDVGFASADIGAGPAGLSAAPPTLTTTTPAGTASQSWFQRNIAHGSTGETTATGAEGKGTILEGVGKVAKGKATFGIQGTTGQVVGALAQGLFWGVLLYGVAKFLLPVFGADEETTDAAATALFAGGVSFGIIKASAIYLNPSSPSLFGLSAGQAGFLGGAAIAVVVFLILYQKEKKEFVQVQCLPWEPPLGGTQCEECNKDPNRPCSEYRCKSLGQACELENKGTQFEQCIWKSKFDVYSPIIRPWDEALRPTDLRYIPDTVVRPPKLGVRIVRGSNGCVEAFTPLQFGVTLNEPARCRVDYNHTDNFSQMQWPLGDNYLLYNHTLMMRLPGPGNESLQSPLLQNDGTFSVYARCMDAN